MEEVILPHFKISQLEPYDGTFDLLDHLGSYKAQMMIQGSSDALHCIAFQAILKKVTWIGYSSFKPSSNYSLDQLEELFMAHF